MRSERCGEDFPPGFRVAVAARSLTDDGALERLTALSRSR
jgi:hypothetical protein